MKKKTALFVGRFQPLHKGHVHAIRSLLRKYGSVVIAIGSINKRNADNPFSYSLRRKMVFSVFGKYNNIKVIGVRDCASDKKWAQEISKKAKFDTVVTGNEWTKRCLKNFECKKPEFLEPKVYNATKIRKRMRSGKKWSQLVPPAVFRICRKRGHS